MTDGPRERYSRPAYRDDGRQACAVPFCDRTRAGDDRAGWYFCGPHWLHVDKRMRHVLHRSPNLTPNGLRWAVREALDASHLDPRC